MSRMPRALRVTERNVIAYTRNWVVMASGFVEPLFYLLSIGVGIGALVGEVAGPGGALIDFEDFVAPGMLAAAAMNGAIADSTFNIFHKLRWMKTYDVMLATPVRVLDITLGELTWAVVRGTTYSAGFLVIMAALGYVASWWAILVVPAAALLAAAFAGAGLAATTFMRTWNDTMWVNLATFPLFLLSTTFYPLEVYPRWLEVAIQFTPLYHGVDLVRRLTLGEVGVECLVHAAYLAGLAIVGIGVAVRRFERVLVE